ncbi:cytochrome b6-f complex iron-sulfur subunit [Hymenobacter daecheongensis DSM 21074]|uniref:Cytochrome b6-f complex iron-sulfur subunit n=1 Tax=Hymenobacter daecheongensis DSM 21074 TaxID=1121955 RepID=A0A1M5ZZ71_9BACT|nr:Rieske (2Fe-2S) protein [Hymenobacter daecheongensis]SHI29446.1 cytochrome b6-f complex iron-sulfur subunit [Hymenobacter daecheongensis DSM 21074]
MERKEFIHLFGLGAAAVLTTGCLGGCSGSKGDDPTPGSSGPTGATSVDFTLDLTAPANADLQDPAKGYVYGAGGQVIVAKTTAGTYLAVQAPCTHQGTAILFQPGQGNFFCPNHGSQFNADGTVANGPAARPLKKYTVTQTGNSLRVTS